MTFQEMCERVSLATYMFEQAMANMKQYEQAEWDILYSCIDCDD